MSLPGSSLAGAKVVCWKDLGLIFPHPSNILLDAGILIALFDGHDYWASDVDHLWSHHIDKAPGDKVPGLWTNSYILGEYIGMTYRKAIKAGQPDTVATKKTLYTPIREMLSSGLVQDTANLPLKGSMLLDAMNHFEAGAGVADAFHIAEMLKYSFNLATTDLRLAFLINHNPEFADCTVYVPRLPDGIIR